VRVEEDGDAGVVETADGMVFEAFYYAGYEIARDADFEGDLIVTEMAHECRVLNGGDAVTDALGAEFEGGPHGSRCGALTGVGGETEAGIAREGIDVLEPFGGTTLFAASDADSDNAAVDALGG